MVFRVSGLGFRGLRIQGFKGLGFERRGLGCPHHLLDLSYLVYLPRNPASLGFG